MKKTKTFACVREEFFFVDIIWSIFVELKNMFSPIQKNLIFLFISLVRNKRAICIVECKILSY